MRQITDKPNEIGDFPVAPAEAEVLRQDLADGIALRRLRELLPRHVRIDVILSVVEYGSRVVVKVDGYVAMGATIAEAADASREAWLT